MGTVIIATIVPGGAKKRSLIPCNSVEQTPIDTTQGKLWVAVIGVCGSVAVAAINKFPIGGPSPDPKSADTTGPTETIEIKVPPGPISPPTSLVWFVQLGYFESLANAEQTKADLEGKGIKDIKILDASHLPIWACRKGGNFLVIGPATQDVARKMQL